MASDRNIMLREPDFRINHRITAIIGILRDFVIPMTNNIHPMIFYR